MDAMAGQTTDRSVAANGLAAFPPGYFALVMATGITSVAAHFQGREWLALGLFGVNLVAYVVLWGLTLLPFIRFRIPFLSDLTHHARGATFLTTAAATGVLGSQFALLSPWMGVAECLWFLGVGLTVVLSYTFITAVIVCEPKPPLAAGINGAWLLVVVATESIAVLGAQVARLLPSPQGVLFVSLAAYLVGAMLYLFLATLILYRLMFFRLLPEEFTPDYWIGMGALAITTLAGTLLIKAAPLWSLLQVLTPFLAGSVLLFWATATWWIPLLVATALWRHLYGRVPLQYRPDYWTLVFPLGMYAAATFMLVKVTGLTFLNGIAELFTYVALVAWSIVFAGMLRSMVGRPFVN
jgi:tellurite resistance protein TehA-like permease